MNKMLCELCLTRIDESKTAFEIFNNKISEILSKYLPNEMFIHLNELKQHYQDGPFVCLECWQKFNDFHEFMVFIKECHLTNRSLSATVNIKCEVKLQYLQINDNNEPTTAIRGDDIKLEQIVNDDLSNDTDTNTNLFQSLEFNEEVKAEEGIDSNIDNFIDEENVVNTDLNKKTFAKQQKNTKRKIQIVDTEKTKRKIQIEKQNKRIIEFYQLKCALCGHEIIDSYELFRSHYQQEHNVKRPYLICCKKKLIRRSQMLEHIDWHTNPNKFKCKFCGKIYRDQKCLTLHMHYHSAEEEKIFICDDCGKGFSLKYLLAQHLRNTHISVERKIHKCNQCDVAFAKKSILQSHIRGVHEYAHVHVCDICAKVFKTQQQYKLHMADHPPDGTQPVKHSCPQCSVQRKTMKSLKLHIRQVHNAKDEECPICKNVFRGQERLRCHYRFVHLQKPVHKCTYCDKSFKRAISLKEHIASHQGGERLYECEYCSKAFNSISNKYKHRKKVHYIEWEQNHKK